MLSQTEWKVVKQLVKKEGSPTELAKKLNFSIQNVDSLLKKLEQKKLVIKKIKKGKTRPFTVYSLGKGFVYFIEAVPGKAERKFLEVDNNLKIHLNTWSIPQKEFHYYLEDFWWGIKKYWNKIESLVVFGSVAKGEAREGSDIDILILTKREEKGLEKKTKAFLAGTKEENKIVMAQVFTFEEFKKKLEEGSKFAKEILKDGLVIYDKENKFFNLRNEYKS